MIIGREIQSLSRLVTLRLSDGCDRWFSVRFPCPTIPGSALKLFPSPAASPLAESSDSREYAWIEQQHPVDDCPERWCFPLVRLLQHLKLTVRTEKLCAKTHQLVSSSSSTSSTISQLPSSQRHVSLADPRNARFGYETNSSLPAPVKLMATSTAIYSVISTGADVEILWLQDQSCFFTQNRFRYVSLNSCSLSSSNGKPAVVMFKMELAPTELFHPERRFYYPLGEILQTASSILAHNAGSDYISTQPSEAERLVDNKTTRCAPRSGEELLESTTVSGIGEFRMYADGRLRAVFDDFTIADLKPAPGGGCGSGREQFELVIILRNGDKLILHDISLAMEDVRVKPYMVQMLRFRHWAAEDPEERGESERRWLAESSMIRSALLRCQRFIGSSNHDSMTFHSSTDPLTLVERMRQRNAEYLSK